MILVTSYARQVWCLVRKDLRRECRAPLTWPAALLLGLLLALTLELHMELPPAMKLRTTGGLLWLAVFISGALSLERSFGDEQDQGCWDALRMYPIAPAALFTAKMLFNFATLVGVAGVLILLFVVLADAPLLDRPGAMLAIVLLANLGLAAIGTLIGAITSGMRQRGNLIALLLLPLVLPVVLGAGEATRLMIAGDVGEPFGRWLQLLAAFALMFSTIGMLVFDLILED
jgi:heme exporter protein B